MNKILNRIVALCAVFLLASCASKKAVVSQQAIEKEPISAKTEEGISEDMQQLTFVRKVSDARVYAQNIVGGMSFTFKRGDKSISAPGSLHMRKDKVIRLQVFVPLLGTEVGRIEFTPDYVLVIDRLHKEYVKAGYDELEFLRNNGLTFYSLQALFWNQLLVPGKQNVSEADLKRFEADLSHSAETVPLTLKNGKMEYRWNANKNNGQIRSAEVTYASGSHGKSTLTWNYDRFKNVGVKQFPAKQVFGFSTSTNTTRQHAQVTIDMNDVTTNDSWEERTTVSDRYTKMDAKDILSKLLSK